MLADPDSVHTEKWAKSLANKGIEIFIFGLTDYQEGKYEGYKNISVYSIGYDKQKYNTYSKDVSKALNYIKTISTLKRIIKEFSPTIMHAHFASSYGLIGALSGFKPFIISCWGYDIVSFPKKSFIHRCIMKYNFSKANKILTTSYYMKDEVALYSDKNVEVTPFGIDIEKFKPCKVEGALFNPNDIVIGTVKALEEVYGIEYLIKAFKSVRDENEELSLKLLLVGGGPQENELKKLVKTLDIEDEVIFAGRVKHEEVINFHNMIDISVYLSNNESFGVAVIEASACGKPVVVSNVGGLPEVVRDGLTGYVVPKGDIASAVKAIQLLVKDANLRKIIGENGRKYVMQNYNWDGNVQAMINIYEALKHK